MAKKKVLNVGKIMVLSGAVVILVLVALWCGSLLKLTHEQKNESSEPVPQSTMSVNVIVPPTTTTTTTTPQTTTAQTTSTTESFTETVTGTLTVRGNGEFQEYIMKLANPALDIYSEPSYNSMITGTITDRGSYVIIKETVDDDGNKWGLLETEFGWINLMDARKADPNDDTYSPTDSDEENENNDNDNDDENNNDLGNSNYSNNQNGGLTGVDADGDGWDDGWNPDAWCIYCGYDSYYNATDGNYYCSQGHVWSY
ncbi:MAG: hypothetical protein NC177_15460 [Ruminococcus flavefaciens]|nr:hypothetical protein [Ruminococcus flavefaciens]